MKNVGQFQLIEKIGAGGMGVVYKARDDRLQRTVALKFLPPEQLGDSKANERQLREARAAAALNHPNIATIYEIGESHEGRFIAMEYVDGDLLHDRVKAGPIPLDLALDWALQLCEAIAAAHDLGIIHRDVKTMNIMISDDNTVKMLDFGVALRHRAPIEDEDDTNLIRLTEDGTIVGTIHYLAPEVLRGGEASPASDVFSIGVVLYEVLTGKMPFAGSACAQVMYQIINVDPQPLVTHRAEIDPELDKMIRRALAKDPTERHSSARELLTELRSIAVKSATPTGAVRQLPDVPSNLPASTTRFIGRQRELDELEARLVAHRLVTLTGPGGAGKTRLGLELAALARKRFPDGVYFVELAALTEPAQVARAIARVLSVREERDRELAETIGSQVGSRSVLIVLDNCEHLIEASAVAARRLLELAPSIKIVATSQHRLDVPGEVVWQISTLTVPSDDADTLDRIAQCEAVQLFNDRAKQVNAKFSVDERNAKTVAQICRRLEGIPLAIELAAVRVRLLTPDQILSRLEDRFKLLRDGSRTSLPRQQTLRATVEWSLDLLSDVERRFFRYLSVFAGGMSLEAAENVCSSGCQEEDVLDLLGTLIDKSLVNGREGLDGELRYHVLDTLREFGATQLQEHGDESEVRNRHAEFFLGLVEEAQPELTGPNQAHWFDRLDLEADNITGAILWLVSQGQNEAALRMSGAIWRFWFIRGYLATGRELLGAVLAAAKEAGDARARALYGAGVLGNDQGDYDAARRYFEECLAIRRAQGDRSGVAQTLNSLGITARDQGDYARARELLEEGLAINREIEHRPGSAMSIHALGITAHREGDCEAARKLFEEGFEIRKSLGDRRGIGALLAHLGSVDYDLGRYDEAERQLEDALAIFRELRNKRGIVYALMFLGGVARRRGELDTARSHHIQCLRISRDMGDKQHIVQSLEWLASLAVADKDYERAIKLEGASSMLREEFRAPRTPIEKKAIDRDLTPAREALGQKAAGQARTAGASRSLEAAIALALGRS